MGRFETATLSAAVAFVLAFLLGVYAGRRTEVVCDHPAFVERTDVYAAVSARCGRTVVTILD